MKRIIFTTGIIWFALFCLLGQEQALDRQLSSAQASSWRDAGFEAEMAGDWAAADSLYNLSLNAYRGLGDSLEVARVLKDKSIQKQTEGNFVAQLKYAEEGCRAVATVAKRDTLAGDLAIDLANAYLNFGNAVQAYDFFQEALKIHEGNNDSIGIAKAQYGLANAAQYNNKLDDATNHIRHAIQIFKHLSDTLAAAQSFNLLAVLYLDQQILDSAEWFFAESLSLATVVDDPNLQSDALRNLIGLQVILEKPDSKQTEEYFQRLTQLPTLQDTARNTDFIRELTLKLQLRNNLLQSQKGRQKQIISILILGLLILAAVFFAFRSKKEKEIATSKLKQQEQQHQVKEKINKLLRYASARIEQARQQGAEEKFAEIRKLVHNTIGSQLAATKWTLEPLIESFRKREVPVDQLEHIQSMIVRAFKNSRNIERMIENEADNWMSEIDQFFTYLQNSSNKKPVISYERHGSLFPLPPGTGSRVYQIVNIVVANVLCHAQADHFNCQVNLSEDEFILIADDDGKGFNVAKAEAKSDSTGIKNLKKMVSELDGEVKIDSTLNQGTTITVTIPFTTES